LKLHDENSRKGARRAQFFAVDIVTGMAFVLLLIFIYAAVAGNFDSAINQREESMAISEAAGAALNQLVLTAGSPSDWDELNFSEQTMSSIGIASDANVLDPGKLGAFLQAISSDANRSIAADMLGLRRPGYDFGFGVAFLNGTAIGSFGAPPSNATATSERSAFAVMGNETVSVKIIVWKKY